MNGNAIGYLPLAHIFPCPESLRAFVLPSIPDLNMISGSSTDSRSSNPFALSGSCAAISENSRFAGCRVCFTALLLLSVMHNVLASPESELTPQKKSIRGFPDHCYNPINTLTTNDAS